MFLLSWRIYPKKNTIASSWLLKHCTKVSKSTRLNNNRSDTVLKVSIAYFRDRYNKENTIYLFGLNFYLGVALVCLITLTGCQSASHFHLKDLVKTDINQVSEIHINQSVKLLKTLTKKMYKMNPYELKKSMDQTIESRIAQIFLCPMDKKYEELDFKEGTEAILLGFEPEYKGDRVFAIIFGLYTMIHKSYNSKCELFILDFLNEQYLYNSARNIEILVWRLKIRKTDHDKLYLLTNSLNGDVKNLSYERIFGKLISLQDTMALIVSQRTGRLIKKAAHVVGMSFLPISI